MLLFGLIATVGFRTLKENNVDLNNNRNVVLISVILIVALSGLQYQYLEVQFQRYGTGSHPWCYPEPDSAGKNTAGFWRVNKE